MQGCPVSLDEHRTNYTSTSWPLLSHGAGLAETLYCCIHLAIPEDKQAVSCSSSYDSSCVMQSKPAAAAGSRHGHMQASVRTTCTMFINYCIVAACGLAALAEMETRQVFVHLSTAGWTIGRQHAYQHKVPHCDGCLTKLHCFMWQAVNCYIRPLGHLIDRHIDAK